MEVQTTMLPPPPPPPPPPPAFFTETVVPPPPPPSLTPPQLVTTTTIPASVASPPTQDRIWLHPWTITEMRENASQWSLAGDAGLLLYLEQFSDKLIQRADTIQQHLGQTVNAVKSTHTRVQNCLNEFTSLANTQFIENRVYDEDETVNAASSKKDEVSTDKANVSSSEAQEKVLHRYIEAIQYGLGILETHFERVETKLDNMPNGGASFVDDDEDGGVPIEPMLEPKDPYIFRPLPYLIGTTEFMEDDYVGLGDLLNVHEEEPYVAEKHAELEIDSALSTSDTDDEDFEVRPIAATIVKAGASRPAQANQQPPSSTSNTFGLRMDDSDEDDNEDRDPFRDFTGPKFDNSPSKPLDDDGSFDETIGPAKPVTKESSSDDSDGEENDLFDNKNNKPLSDKKTNNDDFDRQSSSSKESEEVEKPKTQIGGVAMFTGGSEGMSELERRVLDRRRKMGDFGFPPDDEDDANSAKPTETATKTIPSLTVKSTPKPPSKEPPTSVISELTNQPLSKPPIKTSGSSIFGHPPSDDEDEDGDIFGPPLKPPTLPTVKPPSTIKTETILTSQTKILPKKKEKIFGSSSDEDDALFPSKKGGVLSAVVIKKSDSNSKLPSPASKPNLSMFQDDDDKDDNDFFAPLKIPVKQTSILPTTTMPNPQVPSSVGGSIDISKTSKPQTPAAITTKNSSDDDDNLFAEKAYVKPQLLPPVIPSLAPIITVPVKNRMPLDTESSDDDKMFGISTDKSKKSTSAPQRVVLPPVSSAEADPLSALTIKPIVPIITPKKPVAFAKSDDDDDGDDIFGLPTGKSKAPREVTPNRNDQDNDLFRPKSQPGKPAPSSTTPVNKAVVTEDPLFAITKPVETAIVESTKTPPILSVPPTKKPLVDSDEDVDDDSGSKRLINKGVLEDGQVRSVRELAGTLKIPLGSHIPGARPKPSPAKQEPVESFDDDTPSVVNSPPPPPSAVKKPGLFDSDSDEDFLNRKKNEPVANSRIEQENQTGVQSESGRNNFKDVLSRITINPKLPVPVAQSRPLSSKENQSETSPEITTSETTKLEPTLDKTVSEMLKGRPKGSANRAPRTKEARLAAIATASSNESNDLFGLPSTASTTTLSPPSLASTVMPIVSPPPSLPTVVSPPTPVTGLPDNTAAISSRKSDSNEKKKFSLFDSDDSDIDEMLFGSNKKNKSSPASKSTKTSSTTSKTAVKTSALLLDDGDDDDFLSKRPVKKNTKPVDNDDIFADVKGKAQQTNKAKKDWSIMNKSTTNETDDIFNEASAKSSTPSKSKASNVKNKSAKDLDDIFDDPLNVASKR